MLTFSILIIFNLALINAGKIDVSEIYPVVENDVSGLLHANLNIGANLNQVDKKTLPETLRILVPGILNAKGDLIASEKLLLDFINNLEKENETKLKSFNLKFNYVPDSVLKDNYVAVTNINKAYNNIVITLIVNTILNLENTIKIIGGNAIIPEKFQTKLITQLKYLEVQFKNLDRSTVQFHNALVKLAEAISLDANSRLGSFVFKHSSTAAGNIAHLFGIIATDFNKLITSLNAYPKQPNGDIKIPVKKLVSTIINTNVQGIGNEFNRIADALQLLLDKIDSSESY